MTSILLQNLNEALSEVKYNEYKNYLETVLYVCRKENNK